VGCIDQYAAVDKNLAKGLHAKYWIGCSAGFLAGGIQREFSAFDIKNDISMRYWMASEMCAERI